MSKKPHKTIPLSLKPEDVPVGELLLDAENPRVKAYGCSGDQKEILKLLWREFAVDEIALSIAANGFFRYEPLFAVPEQNRKIVIEGNRRLAAVQLLRSSELRQYVGATDLPSITHGVRDSLDNLPVIVCSRNQVWQHLGFKHVNGPQAWDADSKAEYIAWVHNQLGVPLRDIARTIGDQHQTVERLYRARMILEQAERARQFDRDDRYKRHFSFSHLYTGLGYTGIQKFLGLSDKEGFQKNPIKSNRLPQLGELMRWMYGSKSLKQEPVVQSQNPDLRYLDEVLQHKDGIVALRRNLPLSVALDIARGDERLFREALQGGKQSLQKAIGTLLTGYKGEPDLLRTAEDIQQLGAKLVEEMRTVHDRPQSQRSRR